MKTTAVLRAAAFWSLKPRVFDRVSPLVLVDAVKQRYHFSQSPNPDQLAFSAQSSPPASFVYGKMNIRGRDVVIEQLLVTYLGTQVTSVAASTRTSTDDADVFLKELSEWVREEYGVDVSTIYPVTYTSTLEVIFDKPLRRSFKQVEVLGREIGKIVRSYGFDNCPDFEFSGFSLGYDSTSPSTVMWVPFSIERRLGVPYEDNAYFSQAPLRTKDHERLLEKLERIVSVS